MDAHRNAAKTDNRAGRNESRGRGPTGTQPGAIRLTAAAGGEDWMTCPEIVEEYRSPVIASELVVKLYERGRGNHGLTGDDEVDLRRRTDEASALADLLSSLYTSIVARGIAINRLKRDGVAGPPAASPSRRGLAIGDGDVPLVQVIDGGERFRVGLRQ